MINNVGIDIIENRRILLDESFINKILTNNELQIFNTLENKKRKIEFLAGRWAVKEAIIKVFNKNEYIAFNKLNIIYKNDKIMLENHSNILISISHENKYTVAIAIKKETKDD